MKNFFYKQITFVQSDENDGFLQPGTKHFQIEMKQSLKVIGNNIIIKVCSSIHLFVWVFGKGIIHYDFQLIISSFKINDEANNKEKINRPESHNFQFIYKENE